MKQNNERAIALSEKTIVVTGASRGLGRAVAIEFAARGAQVLGLGRDESALQETAHLAGAGFSAGTLDVRDEAAVTKYFAALPSLDVLINNAGIARIRPLLETPAEELREILEINVVAAFVVLREAARKMAQSGGGHIINIASDAATRGIEGMAPYVASKHALLGLSRSAHLEWKPLGVRLAHCVPARFRPIFSAPVRWLRALSRPPRLPSSSPI
jgi:gluconate 5-dehydrogenase